MTFLAPWALAIAGAAAAGLVLLHLVAQQRPAAYLLPTTRFIPDKRTLVSRAATRPRDLLLLLLRVLLLLAAGAAFARPVLTPSRGTMARVVVLDRSRAVANMGDAIARARDAVSPAVPTTLIVFDSIPVVVPVAATTFDSLARVPRSGADGSLSAALIAARREAVLLADASDSVRLVVISPFARSAIDSATPRLRAQWPGGIQVEHVALRADSGTTSWRLERPLPADDPLGPAVFAQRNSTSGRATRLIRRVPSALDSAFARDGGTVVRWDSTAAAHPTALAVSAGSDLIVAALGKHDVAPGYSRARWADGTPAATEVSIGAGCIRDVGIAVPSAGDLPLHAPFQRIVRMLLAPCGLTVAEVPADSAGLARLSGNGASVVAGALRNTAERSTPLSAWLLALAMLLGIAELAVRARATGEAT